jgi:hypothetical protein
MLAGVFGLLGHVSPSKVYTRNDTLSHVITSKWEPLGSDVSNEGIEPGSMQASWTLNLMTEDNEEFLPAANSYPSHHPIYTRPKSV